ncbi:uncharacterized protein EV422DRAFT_604848 [Fimicolochytrium jonesii]|uniref:uncharacterized protein n=1 Tax=Fimicolochytrium jonesii TaxID=1396493 RepID=UPI0022FE3A63|nr:uncharacterized protein EV422DRAFT_604848 [Fimicolochytrium jonesii]KAI8817261.1 hypothetical protein EV422DRAFT_604848 [Fimicolochytrium jonesii]
MNNLQVAGVPGNFLILEDKANSIALDFLERRGTPTIQVNKKGTVIGFVWNATKDKDIVKEPIPNEIHRDDARLVRVEMYSKISDPDTVYIGELHLHAQSEALDGTVPTSTTYRLWTNAETESLFAFVLGKNRKEQEQEQEPQKELDSISIVADDEEDVAVELMGKSSDGTLLGLAVGGEKVVVDMSDGTIETGTHTMYLQSIEETADRTLSIDAIAAEKSPDKQVKKARENMLISIVVAVIIALLGRNAPGKPCVVNFAEGFPVANGTMVAVPDIAIPSRPLAVGLSGLQLANLCLVGAEPPPAGLHHDGNGHDDSYSHSDHDVATNHDNRDGDSDGDSIHQGDRKAAAENVEKLAQTVRALDAARANITDVNAQLAAVKTTSSEEVRLVEMERQKVSQEVERLTTIVVPELSGSVRNLTLENEAMKSAIRKLGTELKHTEKKVQKAENSLTNLEAKHAASREESDHRTMVAASTIEEYRQRTEAVLTLYGLAEAGITLPAGLGDTKDLSELVQKVQALEGTASTNAAKMEVLLFDSIAFHEGQDKMLRDPMTGNRTYTVAKRWELIRHHKGEISRIREALMLVKKERKRQKAELSAAWVSATSIPPLRASQRTLTEIIAPTIVAERKPDGTYAVVDDAGALLMHPAGNRFWTICVTVSKLSSTVKLAEPSSNIETPLKEEAALHASTIGPSLTLAPPDQSLQYLSFEALLAAVQAHATKEGYALTVGRKSGDRVAQLPSE